VTFSSGVLAAENSSLINALQTLTNMTRPHEELIITKDEKIGDWLASTGVIGREVAGIACVLGG
jgi:hypothetical protein